eukprot:Lankesteria_metandrocarpae@DN3359_c0_g1_i1.p2
MKMDVDSKENNGTSVRGPLLLVPSSPERADTVSTRFLIIMTPDGDNPDRLNPTEPSTETEKKLFNLPRTTSFIAALNGATSINHSDLGLAAPGLLQWRKITGPARPHRVLHIQNVMVTNFLAREYRRSLFGVQMQQPFPTGVNHRRGAPGLSLSKLHNPTTGSESEWSATYSGAAPSASEFTCSASDTDMWRHAEVSNRHQRGALSSQSPEADSLHTSDSERRTRDRKKKKAEGWVDIVAGLLDTGHQKEFKLCTASTQKVVCALSAEGSGAAGSFSNFLSIVPPAT